MKDASDGKQGKIQEICEQIRKEALQPAEKEAEEILSQARKKAQSILSEAEDKKHALLEEAIEERKERERAALAAMRLAYRQTLARLRNEIEEKLFSPQFEAWIEKEYRDPYVASKVITAIVQAFQKQGIHADLITFVGKSCTPASINALLGKEILKTIKQSGVNLGAFEGGVQVVWKEENLTLDCSEEAIKTILSQYIREEFRELLFCREQEQGEP